MEEVEKLRDKVREAEKSATAAGIQKDAAELTEKELLARLESKLPAAGPTRETVAYHDPCYLGRYQDKYDQPRAVIAQTATVVEAGRSRERSFCCGAGGGQMFLGEEKGKRVNLERVEELVGTGAQVIGTACPFCQTMFRDALGTMTQAPPKLLDIAQIAAASLPQEVPPV